MLHQIFELISVIGLVLGIGITYIVALYQPSPNQKRVLLVCCSAFLVHMGNYFSLFSTEYQALYHALQLKTVGHILVLSSFTAFMVGLCNISVPKWLRIFIHSFNLVCIWCCVTSGVQNMFFKELELITDVEHPYIRITPGFFYLAFRIVNILYIVFLCVLMLYGMRKRNSYDRARNTLMLMSVAITTVADFMTSLEIMPGYDFVASGLTISFILLYIGVRKVGILDTMQLAKDSVLEESEEGLIVVDADKRFVYANKKAIELMPYLNTAHKDFAERKIKEIFDNEHYMINTPSGKYEAKVSTIGEKGYVRGYMAWLINISFIDRYTKEIIELKEAAEAANQSKSAFLASMSHEIRTPMNAIVGFNELILQNSKDQGVLAYATDIKLASTNLLSIINDILDISKIESGKVEIRENEYRINDLIKESVINIMSMANNKGIEFIMDIDKKLPRAYIGDNDHIRNILINLLNNAIKYTNSGFVKFIVKLEGLADDNATIRFSVADSGIGIKEEDMPRLFEQFAKFDLKKNIGVEGTGLGLTIVKNYVEILGGQISVESEYGLGSTFTVVLPQKVIDFAKIDEDVIESKPDISSKRKHFKAPNARILITDDNNINLKVSSSLLSTYDIRVDTADSGKRAIEMCRTNPYDIIFMDQMMPEMDGVEAMKRIRTLLDDDTYHSIIIALTANAVSGVREQMKEEGFDDYISKPIDIAYMEETLIRYLPEELIVYMDEDSNDEEAEASEQNTGEVAKGDAIAEDTFENCLAGFNVSQGIINCGGDRECYEEILQIYYESGETRITELEGFLEDKDYKNYVIAVHGLKSSSASIGAMELSECAKAHEFSGKDEKYDFLHEDFAHLIELYRNGLVRVEKALRFCGRISGGDSVDSTVEETDVKELFISEEVCQEALNAIKSMIAQFDYEGVRRIAYELNEGGLAGERKENIDSLIKALNAEDAKEMFRIKDML